MALFGFVGLAVVLVMFYFAAWMLDTDQRACLRRFSAEKSSLPNK